MKRKGQQQKNNSNITMFVFPIGIRFVEPGEIPNSNAEKSEMLEEIRNAKIKQGFVISEIPENSIFKFYAEANINADKIWGVFRALCENLLPEKVMPIIGELADETLHCGKYEDKTKLLNLLEEFQFYLSKDCYTQFGLGYKSETELSEIFVTPTKHFQIWISDAKGLKRIMQQYDIPEFEKLQFIDEFPRATITLEYKDKFQNYNELIDYLVEETGEYSDLINE